VRLLSVTVENYRVLKATSVAFDPARTVIGGEQEVGKSTLVEAIHNALFLKSRGISSPHKAMRSDLHAGHPAVAVSFEAGGRRYTIKKTFAGNTAASATVLTDEGPAGESAAAAGGRTLHGEEAEAKIHELLHAENIGSRTVDSRLKMQWAHLWVWQGSSGSDPVAQANAEQPAEQLRHRLGRLGGGGVLESSLDARVSRTLAAGQAAIFRENGGIKTGSELFRAGAESDQAEAAFAAAALLVNSLDAAVETMDSADRTIATAEAALAAHAEELRLVNDKLRTVGDLRISLAEEQAAARAAAAAHDEITRADAEITACERQLADLVESIEPATNRLAALEAAERDATEALTAALDAVDASGTRHQEAAAGVALLELCEQRARLTVEQHRLGGRCRRIDALRDTITRLESERKNLPVITAADVAQLDKLERARDAAAATLDAIATKVELMIGPGPAHLAGDELAAGAAVTITAESELTVGPSGNETILRISPGGGRSLADATRAEQAAQRELATALDALKITSAALARQTVGRLQAIEAEIAAQQTAIDGLGGDAAGREFDALVAKIASVAAEIHRRCGTDLDAGQSADGFAAAATDSPDAAIRQAEAVKAEIHARLVAAHADRDTASKDAASASAAATAARRRHEEVIATRRQVAESIQTSKARIDSIAARRSILIERFGGDRAALVRERDEAARAATEVAKATERRLAALAPETLTRERARLERAVANLQSQRHDAETARQVAREKLRREGTEDPRDDLARATVRRRLAAAQLTRSRRNADATKLLASLFAAKKRAVETQFVAPLASRVADYLQTILGPDTAVDIAYEGGRFEKLAVARGELGNIAWDFASLSGGTREQVAAAFRLAMAEILAEGHDGSLPIIFDDAFTNADDKRQLKLQRLLDLAADRGLQVIVFSCTPAAYAGLGARQVLLQSPLTGPDTAATGSPAGA
jgi:DNA repair exonuclease SbcCD ATPase subunit